jgi:hypothetical protein
MATRRAWRDAGLAEYDDRTLGDKNLVAVCLFAFQKPGNKTAEAFHQFRSRR